VEKNQNNREEGLFITSSTKVNVKNGIQCLFLKRANVINFEKDWLKKLTKILKRRARGR
jgi:hypothetical protein